MNEQYCRQALSRFWVAHERHVHLDIECHVVYAGLGLMTPALENL